MRLVVVHPGTRSAALAAGPLALCVCHEMDFLVTWNMRHMANLFRQEKINRANLEFGQSSIKDESSQRRGHRQVASPPSQFLTPPLCAG
jgi:hypothetical protein